MTDGGEDPTRGDIMEMIEKDVAFSSLENRKLLMGFIKKICQAPVTVVMIIFLALPSNIRFILSFGLIISEISFGFHNSFTLTKKWIQS